MAHNHGNTVAAWSGVGTSTIGFLIAAVGLLLSPINLTIFFIGMVVAVAGLPLFIVLRRLGFDA